MGDVSVLLRSSVQHAEMAQELLNNQTTEAVLFIWDGTNFKLSTTEGASITLTLGALERMKFHLMGIA